VEREKIGLRAFSRPWRFDGIDGPRTLFRRSSPLAPIDLTFADREIYEIYEIYEKYGAEMRSMYGADVRSMAERLFEPS